MRNVIILPLFWFLTPALVSAIDIPDPIPPPPLKCPNGQIAECNPVSDATCVDPCGELPVPNPGVPSPAPQNPTTLPLPNSIKDSSYLDLTAFRNRYDCYHPDGNLFREHWLACGYTVDILTAQLGQIPPQTNGCDTVDDFTDGKEGAVWKPVSEKYGTPVFLLPKQQCGLVTKTQVWDATNFISDTLPRYDGNASPCGPNGSRPHYDVPVAGKDLLSFAPLTVKIFLEDGSTDCRTIDDPTKRYD